jgi:hypothetical protein
MGAFSLTASEVDLAVAAVKEVVKTGKSGSFSRYRDLKHGVGRTSGWRNQKFEIDKGRKGLKQDETTHRPRGGDSFLTP